MFKPERTLYGHKMPADDLTHITLSAGYSLWLNYTRTDISIFDNK